MIPHLPEARLNEQKVAVALIPLRRIAACPEADSLFSAVTPHVHSCRALTRYDYLKILQSLRGSAQAVAVLTALHKAIPERLHVG